VTFGRFAPLAVAAVVAVPACHFSSMPSPSHRVASSPGTSKVSARAAGYSAARSQPRADPYYPAEGTTRVDVLHYGLNLTWDAATTQLSGTATIRFRATRNESAVSLDFGAPLVAASVRLDGRASTLRTHHAGHKLTIDTGALTRDSRHTLVIAYHGSPQPVAAPTTRRDLPDLGWTVQPDGQVWTLQEPFGAYTWYPVNDQPSDKAEYDITWHTTSAWSGVSNGRLVSDTVSGTERTMHWHLASPAASYLITVAIGPYREYRQTGPHGLPITYWVRDADKSTLSVLRRTPSLLRWLEARLGRFPFDRVGVLVSPTDSSVETQTMVTIGRSVVNTSFGLATLAHELSHQWYGDEVTPYTWKDLWLNESFAMYLQIRWEIVHGYESSASWHRTLNRDDQMLRRRYGPPGDYHRDNFAQLDVYFCGARMLFRLHRMLGSTLFGKVLRGWPRSRRFGNADRADWIRFLDRTTGRNLSAFVHHWLTAKKSPA
jgi:aminopeptidase N